MASTVTKVLICSSVARTQPVTPGYASQSGSLSVWRDEIAADRDQKTGVSSKTTPAQLIAAADHIPVPTIILSSCSACACLQIIMSGPSLAMFMTHISVLVIISK